MSNTFIIIFTKDDNHKNDDKMTFNFHSDHVTLTHYPSGAKTIPKLTFYDKEELLNYVDDMITFFSIDNEPFDTVQLLVPGIPTTLLKWKTFIKKYKHYILRLFENWFNVKNREYYTKNY